MKILRLFIVILLMFSFLQAGYGQSPATKSARPASAAGPKEPAKDKTAEPVAGGAELSALEQRGLNLIQELGERVGELDDRRNAVRMQATAADLLWPHNPERARKMFEEAFDAAVKYYEESKDDNRVEVSKNSWVSRKDVMVEVVRMVNHHDRKLGEEFAEKYVEAKKRIQQQEGAPKNNFDGLFGNNAAASNGLIGMADSLLTVDAKLSANTAMRAVTTGLSPNIAGYLNRLAAKDRAAADRVYIFALDRLKAEAAPVPGQLLALAAYPFGDGEIFVLDGNNGSAWGFGKPKDFTLDPKVVRAFLTSSYAILSKLTDPAIGQLPDAASRYGSAFFAARSLEQKVVEFQPALHEQWQVMANKLSTLAAEQARRQVDNEISRRRNAKSDSRPQMEDADGLLKEAQNTNDLDRRDFLYGQAALAAVEEGDSSRALEIAGSIKDLTQRQNVKSWVSFEAAKKATGKKLYDEARKYALDVESTDQRAYLFFEIARSALGENNRARTLEFLEEAVIQANKADDTPEKVRALLGVSHLYAKLDYNRSFEIATAAVQTANKISDDKLQLGEDEARLTRTLSSRGNVMTNTNNVEGFDPGKVFVELARHDLDRALNLAQTFDNKTVRYSTMLAVAGSMLKKS